jgi:hypothetical protein
MRRWVATVWHASFSIVAGVLYFFFVLPRWQELMGDTSHTLGTVLRIVSGALIGLAALPVVFTLLRTRRPEYGTPQLALTLRVWSIIGHALAAVLIIGTAISEIWLSLDSAGPWLFAVYGAAAAIAVLGVFAFYLAFAAELPPPPPKPLKRKEPKQSRRRKSGDTATDEQTTEEVDEAQDETTEAEADETAEESATSEDAATSESDAQAEPAEVTAEDTTEDTTAAEPDGGGLGNRRPSGKTDSSTRKRRRSRGGVALDD